MAQTETNKPPSLLAAEITKRLISLGISRREFVKRTNLSRQTLHNIERLGLTDLWPSTFRALDSGLGWPEGTAQELSKGNTSLATELLDMDNRLTYVRNQMLGRIASMKLEELEALAELWEGYVLGKPAKDVNEHIAMVEKRVQELETRMKAVVNHDNHAAR